MSLPCFTPFHSHPARGEHEAVSISSTDAFAPSNGCRSLLGAGLFISLINKDFLSTAARTADFPSRGSATAQEAHSGSVWTEAQGAVPSCPGDAQHHREGNSFLRHWRYHFRTLSWFALSFLKWFLFLDSSLLSFTWDTPDSCQLSEGSSELTLMERERNAKNEVQ